MTNKDEVKLLSDHEDKPEDVDDKCEIFVLDDKEDNRPCEIRFETHTNFVNDTKKIPKGIELMGKLYYVTKPLGAIQTCRTTVFVGRTQRHTRELSMLVLEHKKNETLYEDDVLAYATILNYVIKTCWEGPCDEIASALICKSPSLLVAMLLDWVQRGEAMPGLFIRRLTWLWACFESTGTPKHDCYESCEQALRAFNNRSNQPTKRRDTNNETIAKETYREDRYELTESDSVFLLETTKQICMCPLKEATLEVLSEAYKGSVAKKPKVAFPLLWSMRIVDGKRENCMSNLSKTLFLPLVYSGNPPAVLNFYVTPNKERDRRKMLTTAYQAWAWDMRAGPFQVSPNPETVNQGNKGPRDRWIDIIKSFHPEGVSRSTLYQSLAIYPNLQYVLAAHLLCSTRLFNTPFRYLTKL